MPNIKQLAPPPPPPPPPPHAGCSSKPSSAPPLPPRLCNFSKSTPPHSATRVRQPQLIKSDSKHVPPPPPPPPPPPGGSGGQPYIPHRPTCCVYIKKASLVGLHWDKLTRAMQGSLWDHIQRQDSQSTVPEIDMSELKSLFSAAASIDGSGGRNKDGFRCATHVNKPDKEQLIALRRANHCEIMLAEIKIPLPNMMDAVLALDSSALDIDQVENLIKFCPTKREMELLENYKGDRAMLGKCEQFFLELMKVPRVESKLRVFAFKITFSSRVNELGRNLDLIKAASKEIKESVKLRQIMHTILNLGNALNQGTARGSAVGFKLNSLLRLSDTRARNSKMTLMNYLFKLLAEKMPELSDFDKDLSHLEAASKIQLKSLAEEMQSVTKGLEKVVQELAASENDGTVSAGFRKVLKNFLDTAEAEVQSLISLYLEAGRSADSLCLYFGEDPVRCPFEQVTQILYVFVKLFNGLWEENARQIEAEREKLDKENNALNKKHIC